ncbi:WbuC family cupin fold metalloprotein [Enterobacteriaceae bacterium 4M9]|nr:WbuC family cupin fold metalloprotein [Enterobacteriaceae bacterium 4M9]
MRLIKQQKMQQLLAEAAHSERKRAHFLLHDSHQDKVQRLLIVLIQGSYVEPHYHELSHQWEMFVVMEGSIRITTFEATGKVKNSFLAGPEHEVSLVEFLPGEIHSVECLSEHAVMLEIKEGPFNIAYAKTFPDWKS